MKHVDWWVLLFDTIYIGDGNTPDGSLLTLRLEQWASVVYTKSDVQIVEYPWEYELSGYNIVAITVPKSMKLNYVIRFSNKKIAYIQDKKAFDHDEISDMDIWYVIDSEMKDIIERRELGWDVEIVG